MHFVIDLFILIRNLYEFVTIQSQSEREGVTIRISFCCKILLRCGTERNASDGAIFLVYIIIMII